MRTLVGPVGGPSCCVLEAAERSSERELSSASHKEGTNPIMSGPHPDDRI